MSPGRPPKTVHILRDSLTLCGAGTLPPSRHRLVTDADSDGIAKARERGRLCSECDDKHADVNKYTPPKGPVHILKDGDTLCGVKPPKGMGWQVPEGHRWVTAYDPDDIEEQRESGQLCRECDEKYEPPITHILSDGVAMCGTESQPGKGEAWPPGHGWVSDYNVMSVSDDRTAGHLCRECDEIFLPPAPDGPPPTVEVGMRTTVTTETRREVTLSGLSIIKLLRAAGHDVPDQAKVTVYVPGGGDWSNQALDLAHDTSVEVAWTEEERKHSTP